MVTSNCFICDKHGRGDRAQGGVLYEDDLIHVGHVHALDGPRASRGHLMVEPKRHVPVLGQLTDDEAARLGIAVNRAASVVRTIDGVEHVYSFVLGDTVPHLHIHIAPRYERTPREYWGTRIREWSGAPKVDEPQMRRLIAELQQHWGGPIPRLGPG